MRLAVVATALSLSIIGLCAAAEGEAAMRKRTEIPAQRLETALQALAQERELQVICRTEVVGDLRTAGISGELTRDEALTLLLEGTGLTYHYIDEQTVSIVPLATAPKPTTPANATDSDKSFWSRFHLADAGTSDTDSRETQTTPLSSEGTAESTKVDEVLVIGTHIRGVENPTAPTIVMNREFIESTGVTTTTQLIESVPQNFSLVNQSATGGGLSGNSFSSLQGSSINLRGIGEGTTLTLVNGRRMPLGYEGAAVNIVALPLSAVERVEVLTDGASALYGSDAVGGVVNFVLRQDFRGAESQARYGHADGSDEYRLSQALGHGWSSGNVVVSAEHYQRQMLRSSDRNFGVGGTSPVESLLPKENTYAATLFGRQSLGSSVEVFLDVLYTNRESFNKSFETSPFSNADIGVDNWQLSATTGLSWKLGAAWRAELSAGYGKDDAAIDLVNPLSPFAAKNRFDIIDDTKSLDFKIDGPVAELPGGAVRVALGAHRRKESLDSSTDYINSAGDVFATIASDDGRKVGSLFAEASIPLVGQANERAGVRTLDLSLALRYDDYSDFGSSLDPRIGLAWSPAAGLKLRGSWGTSYLAPKLKDYDVAFNNASAYGDFPAPGSALLQVLGNSPDSLKAQESTNYTIGLDWEPAFLSATKFALNYYVIDYKDKIETLTTLPFFDLLVNPGLYGDVVILDPTLEQVNQYIAYGELSGTPFVGYDANFNPDPNFDRSTVDIIIDQRRRNIGTLKTRGIDFSATRDFAAAGGKARVGLDVAYIFELEKQITSSSPRLDYVDTVMNPTQLRARVSVGYNRGGWSFNGFVHHRNSYDDTRFLPYASVGDYTTVDANVAYEFGDGQGVLSGVRVMIGAINLFDEQPPSLRIRPVLGTYDLGFDPANASPLGRLLTLDLTKRW